MNIETTTIEPGDEFFLRESIMEVRREGEGKETRVLHEGGTKVCVEGEGLEPCFSPSLGGVVPGLRVSANRDSLNSFVVPWVILRK